MMSKLIVRWSRPLANKAYSALTFTTSDPEATHELAETAANSRASQSAVAELVRQTAGLPQQINQEQVLEYYFDDLAIKAKVLKAFMHKLQRPIPDERLGNIKRARDLLEFVEATVEKPCPKGLPLYEIFGGKSDQIPPNMTIINYRKKKWTDKMAADFVERMLKVSNAAQV